MSAKDEIQLELAGPDLNLKTVDAVQALELGCSYFEALKKVGAVDLGADLAFRGLEIREKCVAFATKPTELGLARESGYRASQYISGAVEAPEGIAKPIAQLRERLLRLPTTVTVRSVIGDQELVLLPRAEPAEGHPISETISIRAMLIGLIGGRGASARFSSRSERRAFTLKLEDTDTLKRLGPSILSRLDISATVQRDPHGVILSGKLDAYEVVPESTPGEFEEWRKWIESAAADWEGVDDIEKELGRDD